MPEPIIPTYAGAFRCIGAACEDHCCGDWNIPLDRETYRQYQLFPAEKLGATVQDFVFRNAPEAPPAIYAHIYREPSGLCPFFGPDALCGVQKEYGPQLLSSTCSIYPRALNRVDGVLEGALSLSCPEAARNVLLNPDLLAAEADLLAGGFRTDNVFYPASEPAGFHDIRRLLIDMVRDRTRPLWERVVLIGAFAQRLDLAPAASAVAEFRQILTAGGLRAQFAQFVTSPGLRLEVLLALTDIILRDIEGGNGRFREIFWIFIEGVGSAAGQTPADDLGRFVAAERTLCTPLFEAAPHILENFLINYILQHLFPFGRRGGTHVRLRSASAEWLLLALQFAWITTLLVGVAAARRQAFDEADVVHTVQSFTRAFEHDPEVQERALAQIALRGLNNLKSMAMLLKS